MYSVLCGDYCNEDLERILMEYMCLISDLHKKKTGKGFAEVFSEMYNIPSYSINKDAGLIQDNQTGEIIKMVIRNRVILRSLNDFCC